MIFDRIWVLSSASSQPPCSWRWAFQLRSSQRPNWTGRRTEKKRRRSLGSKRSRNPSRRFLSLILGQKSSGSKIQKMGRMEINHPSRSKQSWRSKRTGMERPGRPTCILITPAPGFWRMRNTWMSLVREWSFGHDGTRKRWFSEFSGREWSGKKWFSPKRWIYEGVWKRPPITFKLLRFCLFPKQ